MQYNINSKMEQMFIVSECLLSLGYRKLAIIAQQANYWEFAPDFVSIAKNEAVNRNDYDTLNRLASAGLIYN